MKASIRIFPTIFHDYVDPLVKIDVDNLRVQMRDGPRAGRTCIVRSRLIHDDGSYATDVEHDGASAFMLEFAVLDQHILGEDWIEVVGVLLEAHSWDEPFVRRRDTIDGGPWDGAELCTTCEEPHYIVDHYLPPQAAKIATSDGPKPTTPVYGRYVVVTWGQR